MIFFCHIDSWVGLEKVVRKVTEPKKKSSKNDESSPTELVSEPSTSVTVVSSKSKPNSKLKSSKAQSSKSETFDDDTVAAMTVSQDTLEVSTGKRKFASQAQGSIEEAAKRKELKRLNLQDLMDDKDIVNIAMPNKLKKHLVDEHKLITQESKRLLALPRPKNVSTIISDYLQTKRVEKNQDKAQKNQYAIECELFEGLELYFDKVILIRCSITRTACIVLTIHVVFIFPQIFSGVSFPIVISPRTQPGKSL